MSDYAINSQDEKLRRGIELLQLELGNVERHLNERIDKLEQKLRQQTRDLSSDLQDLERRVPSR
jgi:hypothetical protein